MAKESMKAREVKRAKIGAEICQPKEPSSKPMAIM